MHIKTLPYEAINSGQAIPADEHTSILETISQTLVICDEQGATPMLLEAIVWIYDTARFHFNAEEEILSNSTAYVQCGISSFDAHQTLHIVLLDQIVKMRRRVERFDRRNLAQQLLLLETSLRTHMAMESAVPSGMETVTSMKREYQSTLPKRWINTTVVENA